MSALARRGRQYAATIAARALVRGLARAFCHEVPARLTRRVRSPAVKFNAVGSPEESQVERMVRTKPGTRRRPRLRMRTPPTRRTHHGTDCESRGEPEPAARKTIVCADCRSLAAALDDLSWNVCRRNSSGRQRARMPRTPARRAAVRSVSARRTARPPRTCRVGRVVGATTERKPGPSGSRRNARRPQERRVRCDRLEDRGAAAGGMIRESARRRRTSVDVWCA